MANIPVSYKLSWYDPSKPEGVVTMQNNNVNSATSYATQFSMQDIIDTVSYSGGSIDGSGTVRKIAVFTDSNTIGDSPISTNIFTPGDGLAQVKVSDGYRFILDRAAAAAAGGDQEFAITQDDTAKVSFGWDDDGGGFGFLYNWSGDGWKIGAAGNNPMVEIITTVGSESVDLHKNIQFVDYGSGTYAGTLAKTLGVTSAGDVIEFDVAAGLTGVTNSSSDSPNSKTAFGVSAGGASETGVYNTSIGNLAGSGLTSGGANTIVGYQSGVGITTSNTSVSIGYLTKQTNNTEDTVAIGAQAMRWGTSILGVAIGYRAMEGSVFPNINYGNSVAIGAHTLINSSGSSGSQNTAVGHFAGSINTTGSNNTYLGAQVTGATTGSNNVVLGANATPSSGTVSNEITLGDSSVTVIRAAVTSITALSDERDKKDIVPLSYGLDFINSLEPKEFVWDNRVEKRIETTSTKGEDFKSITTETEVEFYSANKGKKDFGFIAQEVKLLDDDTLRLVYDSNPEKLEMSYGKLVPILVKAIQDLKAELDLKADK